MKKKLVVIICLFLLAGFSAFYRPFFNGEYKQIFSSRENVYFSNTDQGITEGLGTKGWKTFTSKDNSFRFSYPADWKIVEAFSGEGSAYRLPIQSWVLVNFSYEEFKNIPVLPEGATVINFNIVAEGIKQSLRNFLDCGNLSPGQCENVAINSVTYKKTLTSGSESKRVTLATIKDGKVYEISGTINSSGEEAFSLLEEIISTFEIIQSI